MSKLVQHTYKLYNNPFVLTQVLLSFYKNCKISPNNFLLAYLVLPLTLYPPSHAVLRRVQSRSRISKITENKEAIMGLPDRIAEYKRITNLCIQHSIDNKLIKINDMQIEVIGNVAYSSPDLQAAIKAANNLSKIFNSYDVVSIDSSEYTVPEGVITEAASIYFVVFSIKNSFLVLGRKPNDKHGFIKEETTLPHLEDFLFSYVCPNLLSP